GVQGVEERDDDCVPGAEAVADVDVSGCHRSPRRGRRDDCAFASTSHHHQIRAEAEDAIDLGMRIECGVEPIGIGVAELDEIDATGELFEPRQAASCDPMIEGLMFGSKVSSGASGHASVGEAMRSMRRSTTVAPGWRNAAIEPKCR